MRSVAGLTLLETIVAIAICGIILGSLATVSTGSLRESRQGNFKIQATQILDTLGRRIAGGNDPDLLPAAGSPIDVAYEDLDTLLDLGDDVSSDFYQVTVENAGLLTVGSSSTIRYRVEVCYGTAGSERCIRGTTLGRQGGSS